MRRTLFLLAAILAGAVSTASAQRAILVARPDTLPTNPTGLLVHVSGVMNDPLWAEQLANGYTVRMHWTLQLWKKGGGLLGLGDAAQPKREFDIDVQTVTMMQSYVYTERLAGRQDSVIRYSTPDSLNARLATDLRITGQRLAPGDWYYRVEVKVTALDQAQIDQERSGGGGVLPGWIRALMIGSGPERTLEKRVAVKVPKR